MKRLSKLIVWTHRYLGILLSAFFLMWFLTGIGMIYSRGMPRLTPEVRLSRLAPLDLEKIQLSPSEAASSAGIPGAGPATLSTVLDRPAYRFPDEELSVFADTGSLLSEIDAAEARTVAARFMNLPEDRIPEATVVDEPDQWTLQTRLPVFKFDVGDEAGTELYVSPSTAEVVQLTTRSSRILAWVSTIPHFFYFRAIRLDTAGWNNAVVWVSGIGCILAFAGVLLGILYFKPSRPFRLSRVPKYIPYTGWMRWHYALGLIFGVLTLTWVFSGLLSMEPWDWTLHDNSLEEATLAAFPTRPETWDSFPRIDAAQWRTALGSAEIKEIEFASILGEPYYIARSATGIGPVPKGPDGGHQPYYIMRSVDPARWVISASDFQIQDEAFDAERIQAQLRSVLPSANILEATPLERYDTYYYSRDARAPLPVLRLKLDDPDQTWLYVDPAVSQVVGRVNRQNRVERWLYNGLHTLDFPFLYYNRPLWDAIVIILSLGGATVSAIGLLLGLRRVARGIRRTAGALANLFLL